ncbi:CoA-acylating methylmalonate-semialdehyde dehydrogenase [Psychrobacillus sp. OK032]|uniref:CoA-acylating methylmalonate-semialdehyde dehydrogenase n=1 Tax=Psychrobacillus sp. OK032 TaxID=1884358 RepID=UPI0008D2B445|nr:CoA-acylating methylmalonate-semialdehyde dehydrogenase [Psychrobacillus sp. OK032]SER70441.1 methylmalonate-semialdehyde dehydrogenase [acylating] [Psychrobacillus sp. OK032]
MTTIQTVQKLSHFIGGKKVEGTSGRFGEVYNPSTGEVIAGVPLASVEETRQAIVLAKNGQVEWQAKSLAKKMEVVLNFRNLLSSRQDELVDIVCLESGKTKADALGEITRGLESVDLALSAPHLLKGEYSVNVGGNINAFSTKTPLGVVAAIAPFNFPVMVPIAMTSMAVAVGNSVILKPSEKVPHSALFISELWAQAGLPEGVWSVVNGDKEVVDELLKNEDVQAISFVGSTRIAEYVYQTGTQHGKRVAAFGGGKNHMIIMPDADLEQAATAFLGAAYGAASQRCMAISTAMPVGENTAEKFVAILNEKVRELKVGPYTDEQVDFGPVISKEAKQNVLYEINNSIEEGASLVIDGRNPEICESSEGYYLGPTLLDHVTPDMKIYKEEVFGPARIVVRVSALEDAIDLVNKHELGNGVTIYTNNGAASRKFVSEIEVGMVGVNVPIPIPVGYFNFGGWKRSKFGEGHMFGPDTVRFFTKNKTVSERWPEDQLEQASFSFPSN